MLYAVGIAAIVLVLPIDVKDEIDLGTAWDYIPTLLFGLGAVFLARQPRGVLFDVMNRHPARGSCSATPGSRQAAEPRRRRHEPRCSTRAR